MEAMLTLRWHMKALFITTAPSVRSILLVVEGIKDEEIDSICVLKLSLLKQEFYPYLKLDLLF
jgi:hypothetical protein